MIVRSLPIFLFLVTTALVTYWVRNGRNPEVQAIVLAVAFAAIASLFIRVYWDKRREWRANAIARATEKARLRQKDTHP